MSQIKFSQAAAPGAPTSGITSLYAYTDGNLYIQTSAAGPFQVLTTGSSGVTAGQISFGSATGTLIGSSTFTYTAATGDVVIGPPISGVALTVNGVASANTAFFQGGTNVTNAYVVGIASGTATGVSSGLLITAGTNASDNALNVRNAAGSSMVTINGAGNVNIAAPASGAALLAAGTVASFNGNTGSIATATPTTIYATPNIDAIYLVSAKLAGNQGSPTSYSAVALISTSANTLSQVNLQAPTGANVSIGISGVNIQVAQATGGTQLVGINWSVMRLV